MKKMFLLIVVWVAFGTLGCSQSTLGKNTDDTLVIVTKSLLGSTLMVASFDGNGGSKEEDCKSAASALNQAYPGRGYQCDRFGSVSRIIKDEESKQ